MMSPSRMDCTEVEAHLPLFVGGDLEAPLDGLVAAHVAVCGACAAQLESLRGARGALLALTEVERPADVDLWPGVRARLAAEGLCAASAGARPASGRRLWWRAAAGAAAAAALALLPQLSPSDEDPWEAAPAGGARDPLRVAAPEGPAEFEAWIVPASTGALAEAPALEPELVPDGRLRRAGPDDELLRDVARPFPYGRPIRSMPVRGQGVWSLASDGGELR